MDWDLRALFEGENVGQLLINEPMKNHTSFEIGGPVDGLIIPNDEEQIINVIKICRRENIPYFVMGNGSNLLVKDGGIRGLVIKIHEGFNKIYVEDNRLIAEAGCLMSEVSKKALKHKLTGMEFAIGIPGTIGGALTMNAGAYGGEMKDVVISVRAIDRDLNIIDISNEDMNFSYRNSRVVSDGLIVLSTTLELQAGDYYKIAETMEDLTHRRTSKQPLELPSGGSTFKRPEGYYAGKLIQDSGLQGFKCGGAQVSTKHSGFIVNIDNATCKDVLDLVNHVQKTVMEKYGVQLEREIKLIGEDQMYKIQGDYHTHTIYSSGFRNKGTHAIGTIEENANAALKLGLETLVISEHGPRHYLYGLRKDRIKILRDEIDRLNESFIPKGLKILLGIEANLISLDGELDVDEEFIKHLDILLMGYHFGVIPRGLRDFYGLYIINPVSRLLNVFEEKAMDINTKAYLKAMDNYKIDIITHPGSKAKLHIEEIAKKAHEVGTALEISSKHGELSTKSLKLLKDIDVNFYINSDAHRPEDIGNVQAGIKKAEDAQIPFDRILNIKKYR